MTSKQTKKILNFFNGIMLFLFALMSGFAIYTMYTYHLFEFYNINYIVIATLIIIFGVSLWLVVRKKARWVTFILLCVSLLGVSTSYYFMQTTIAATNKINENAKQVAYTMNVVVLKESDITSIDDIDSVAAPTAMDSQNVSELLENIQTNKDKVLTVDSITSYQQGYEDLLAGRIKALVLNSAYADLIEQTNNNYQETIRTIYSYNVQKTIDRSNENVSENNHVLNIYVSGIDTYGPVTSVSRSDVNILMTVNTQTKKVLLTTTPRDAYVQIPDGGNNQYDKLTHAGIYGVEASIHTLENLYNVAIDYYVRLNFTSFLKLIDLVGGVDVANDQEFTSLHGKYYFPIGTVHLDSEKALSFVRERYALTNGDRDRGKNQEKVIAALINKLASVESITNYNAIIDALSDSIQTDMPVQTMIALANDQVSSSGQYTVTSQALEGTGSTGVLPSYAMPGAALYMMQIDEESLAQMKQAITKVMEGQ